MSIDRAGLLSDLVTVRHSLMLILADEAEDAGEVWLPVGWRWLAKHKAWPAYHRQWICTNPRKLYEHWGWRGCGGGFHYDLPGVVYNLLKGGKPRKLWRRWNSEEGALIAAAEAAGEMLKRQQEKTN